MLGENRKEVLQHIRNDMPAPVKVDDEQLVASHPDKRKSLAVYYWFESDWFAEVTGNYVYWAGDPATAKPTGSWAIAGPGVSAEWSTGGESEWNSMGVPPAETNAECHRLFNVSRTGTYRVWVRHYDHRHAIEPFRVTITQGAGAAISGELGVLPVVPPNDEFQLYWGFSFGWGNVTGQLQEGPAKLSLIIEKASDKWRQLDSVLVTDDLDYVPFHREKPPFAYTMVATMQPPQASWRGVFSTTQTGASWNRPPMAGGRDFAM
jgi:hypothetical protein